MDGEENTTTEETVVDAGVDMPTEGEAEATTPEEETTA